MKNIKWRSIPYSQNSAAVNMAIDEAIFTLFNEHKNSTIRLYGWKPSAVSIGRHQKLTEEVEVENIKKFGFGCVRRITGGGAVFHDMYGELTYSVVTSINNLRSKSIEESYYEISDIIFQPLVQEGLHIDYAQIHCPSVFSAGKKISGNAQARHQNVVLQHGTILVDFRPEVMYSVLRARPDQTRTSMIQSVYEHITTLSDQMKNNLTPKSVAHIITESWNNNASTKIYRGSLFDDERRMYLELAKNKFSNDSWTNSK
jgi:lipoate-protein ligase A